MPVDKFGHTDSSSVQRVVAGGVTLTQINNTFMRLDGSNALTGNLKLGGNSIEGLSNPTEDSHLTNKKYVDDQDATKVSKTGDTVNGDFFISASSDPAVDRILGCNNIQKGQRFTLLLGNTGNKISFLNSTKNSPVVIHTANGLRVRINEETAIEIIKTTEEPVRRINVFKDIYMNGARIVGLATPVGAGEVATKKYVDESCFKKCLVGYIPNLEANDSMTGFVASAGPTTSTEGYEPYNAFNNLTSGNYYYAGDGDVTKWLQIRCPESVIIWRLALKAEPVIRGGWNLSGSNDGTTFTTLFSSSDTLQVGASPTFFNISTTTAYQYYRVTLARGRLVVNGIQVMQLYVYDT